MSDVDPHLPLTAREFHILLALGQMPQNGYQVAQRVDENSDGRVRLSPATQYTNLHRLVEHGLVEEATADLSDQTDGRGQRFWTLTALGRRVLRAESRRLEADARLGLSLATEE